MDDPAAPAIVELVRARRGRLELLGEHVGRSARSAATLFGPGAPDAAAIEARLVAWFARATALDAVHRVTVRAGAAGCELDCEIDETAELAPDLAAAGVSLSRVPRAIALPPPAADGSRREWLKVDARPDLSAARAQALELGAEFAVVSSIEGGVIGTDRANLFLWIGRELRTPSLASGAFPGILRGAVVRACSDLGVPLREAAVAPDDVARADDAFLASSALGIASVRSIDGRPLPAPPRGSPWRGLVPRLRLRVHELCTERDLPA